MRAAAVSSGDHSLIFTYDPASVRIGAQFPDAPGGPTRPGTLGTLSTDRQHDSVFETSRRASLIDGDATRGSRVDQRFERFPETFQIALFDLDRAPVIGEHFQKLPSEGFHCSLAVGGLRKVDVLEPIIQQIVEPLVPRAVADVMVVRGHDGHLKSRAHAPGSGLRLDSSC